MEASVTMKQKTGFPNWTERKEEKLLMINSVSTILMVTTSFRSMNIWSDSTRNDLWPRIWYALKCRVYMSNIIWFNGTKHMIWTISYAGYKSYIIQRKLKSFESQITKKWIQNAFIIAIWMKMASLISMNSKITFSHIKVLKSSSLRKKSSCFIRNTFLTTNYHQQIMTTFLWFTNAT